MQVGSVIKSFDFPGITDTFMVGRVVGFEDDYILCETISVTFGGECKSPEVGINDKFRTPKQGCMMFDNIYSRVVELH